MGIGIVCGITWKHFTQNQNTHFMTRNIVWELVSFVG